MRTMTRVPPAGITKLSQLEIDADKDWNGKAITNLGGVYVKNAYPRVQVEGTFPEVRLITPTGGDYPRVRMINQISGSEADFALIAYDRELRIDSLLLGARRYVIRDDPGYVDQFLWYSMAGDVIMFLTDDGDLHIDGSYYTFSPKVPSDPKLIASIIEQEANKREGEAKDVSLMAIGSSKLVAHLYRRIIELEERVKKLESLVKRDVT